MKDEDIKPVDLSTVIYESGGVQYPKTPEFTRRGEWNDCNVRNDIHEFRVVACCTYPAPYAAVGICVKCGLIEGGFAKYD